MKFLKTLFLFCLIVVVLQHKSDAEIIGASRWKNLKTGREVCIYYDCHSIVSLNGYFEHIVSNVFNKSRIVPLTVLVENYQYGLHKKLIAEIDKTVGWSVRFLERFGDVLQIQFPSTRVLSVETRELTFLMDLCVRESRLRVKKKKEKICLPKVIYRKVWDVTKDISSQNIIRPAEEAFVKMLSDDGIEASVRISLEELQKQFEVNKSEYCQLVVEFTKDNEFISKPLIPMIYKELKDITLKMGLFKLLKSDFFNFHLLEPFMEANILWQIARASGAVAVFVGGEHSFHVEKHLERWGYKKIDESDPGRLVSFLKKSYEDSSIDSLDEDFEHKLAEHIVPCAVFDWMLESE